MNGVFLSPLTTASFGGKYDIVINENIEVKAQCAHFKVPLDWNNATESYCSTIDISMKRLYLSGVADAKPAGVHLWMLPGGAGLPGSVNEPIGAGIVEAMNGSVEIYLIDRRGTGKSDFLGCPLPISNFGGCVEWARKPAQVPRIRAQTITNSVKDVIHGIKIAQRGEPEKITTVVLGSSQSSYYLHRMLAVLESEKEAQKSLIDAAIYDSVLPSDVTKLPQSEAIANYAGLNLITRCAQDSNCAAHFPDSNPMRTLYDLRLEYENPTNGSCLRTIGITPSQFSLHLGNMIAAQSMYLIPAVIARLRRCEDRDVAALKDHWMHETAPQPLEERSGASVIAEYINDFSELWFVPGSATAAADSVAKNGCGWMKGVADAALFGTPARSFSSEGCERKEQAAGAFTFPTDQFYLKYPKTNIPLLLMNGEFDPFVAMPWAKHASTKLIHSGSSKVQFIEVPNTAHTPLTSSATSYGGNCGLDLALSFAMSPTNIPEFGCLTQILPRGFDGQHDLNLRIFGVPDAWDDGDKKRNPE